MTDDNPVTLTPGGEIGENDAALIIQADGRIRVVLPGYNDALQSNEALQPHVSMIAGMFLSMKDGTPESLEFMNHCVEHINKKYGDPI